MTSTNVFTLVINISYGWKNILEIVNNIGFELSSESDNGSSGSTDF
jgi:maltoporin